MRQIIYPLPPKSQTITWIPSVSFGHIIHRLCSWHRQYYFISFPHQDYSSAGNRLHSQPWPYIWHTCWGGTFFEWTGFAASLLLFFPIFITQSFLFTDSIVLTALMAATFYCSIVRSRTGYIISGSFLVLTKEPGIFVPRRWQWPFFIKSIINH